MPSRPSSSRCTTGNLGVVREVLRAHPRAVEDELALTVDDEHVAARDLDREQPSAQHIEALDGGDDPDDPSVDVVNWHRECHGRCVADVRLVDLGHVGLPGRAHPTVPVAEGIAAAVDLRRLGFRDPHGAGRIGEEHAVELREVLMQLAQVDQRFLRIELFDALAEPEAPRVRAQHVEVARLAGFDGRRDAPGNGVVQSERLPLFDVDGPDKEQRDSDEDDKKEARYDRVEPPGAVKDSKPWRPDFRPRNRV